MPVGGRDRFQVSLLSKKRYEDAVNEEVMIDKETGEILVKRPSDNGVISYDHMARTRGCVDNVSRTLNSMGMRYKIMGVSTLNPNWKKPFPKLMTTEDNSNVLVDKSSDVGEVVINIGRYLTGYKHFMVYFDVDYVNAVVNSNTEQRLDMFTISGVDTSSYSDDVVVNLSMTMGIILNDGNNVVSKLTDNTALMDGKFEAGGKVNTNGVKLRELNGFVYSLSRPIQGTDKLTIHDLVFNIQSSQKFILHNMYIIGVNHHAAND